MYKKFKYYNKLAKLVSKKTFKDKRNVANFFAYLAAKILCAVLWFLIPVFKLGDVGISKSSTESNKINLFEVFRNSGRDKKYLKVLLSDLLIFIIGLGQFIVGLVIVGLFGGCGFLIGMLLSSVGLTFNGLPITLLFAGVFALPALIGLIIYFICYLLHVSGTNFIIDKEKDIDSSSAMLVSIKSIKEYGKGIIIKSYLLYIINLIWVMIPFGLIGGAGFYVSTSIITDQPLGSVIFYLSLILDLVLFALFGFKNIASKTLQFINTRYYLYKDVVFVPELSTQSAKGIVINDVKKVGVSEEIISKQLEDVFTEVGSKEDDTMILSLISQTKSSHKRTKLKEVKIDPKELETQKEVQQENLEESIKEEAIFETESLLDTSINEEEVKEEEVNTRTEEFNLAANSDEYNEIKQLSKRELRKLERLKKKEEKKAKKQQEELEEVEDAEDETDTTETDEIVNDEVTESSVEELEEEKVLSKKELKKLAKEQKKQEKLAAKEAKRNAKKSEANEELEEEKQEVEEETPTETEEAVNSEVESEMSEETIEEKPLSKKELKKLEKEQKLQEKEQKKQEKLAAKEAKRNAKKEEPVEEIAETGEETLSEHTEVIEEPKVEEEKAEPKVEEVIETSKENETVETVAEEEKIEEGKETKKSTRGRKKKVETEEVKESSNEEEKKEEE